MMFVHPSVTLATFWLSLIFLGLSAIILGSIGKAERTTARIALQRHDCPRCGADIDRDPEKARQWHCHDCGADFLDSGDEVTQGR